MTEIEKALRETFGAMDPDQAQRIRAAYYKAIEGLRTLADTLEIADLEMPGPSSELLIGEHLIACEALDALQKSELDRVL